MLRVFLDWSLSFFFLPNWYPPPNPINVRSCASPWSFFSLFDSFMHFWWHFLESLFPSILISKFFHSTADMLCTISTEKGYLYKPSKLDILFHKVCETAHQFFRKWCKKQRLIFYGLLHLLSFFLLNSLCVTFFHLIHSFIGLNLTLDSLLLPWNDPARVN